MKVSIVIPVYNVEHYIGECFDSIVAQTYSGDMECLFVDDCGTDNSVRLLEDRIENYKGKIKFEIIHMVHNSGPSCARNQGILHATGDYVLFVDSDDTLFPNAIAQMVVLAEKHPGVDVVQSFAKSSLGWLRYEGKSLPEYSSDSRWLKSTMLQRLVIPMTVWNKLIRRQMVMENHLFFEEGIAYEDELWNFMLAKYVRDMAFCKNLTYEYREVLTGLSHSVENKDLSEAVQLMVSRLSGPCLCEEILCVAGLAKKANYIEGIRQILQIGGAKWLLSITERVQMSSKYSMSGLVYRALYRLTVAYVNVCFMCRKHTDKDRWE